MTEEIREALESAADSGNGRISSSGKLGTPAVSADSHVEAFRTKILRFLEEIDGGLSIGELIEELRS